MKTRIAQLTTALAAGAGLGLVALSLPGSAGAASGNGVASLPAKQIVAAAVAATRRVTSLTIAGSIRQGGQTISLKVTASKTGKGGGTIAVNGSPVSVLSTGSTVYVKAGATFWKNSGAPASAARQIAGRWISLPANQSGGSSITSALNSTNFLNQLPKTSDAGTVWVKVSRGTLGGQPVVKLRATNPTKPQDNGVLYVATSGPPYILRVVGSGGSSVGSVTLSRYNQPVNVQAPSGAISLSQLEQQG